MGILRQNRRRARRSSIGRGNMAPVAYYRSGASANREEKTQKKPAQKKRTNNFLVRIRNLAAALALVGLLAYSLLLKPMPDISLSDQSYRSPSQYQQSAASTLTGLSNRNKITVNEKAVTDTLLKNFPEIKSVNLQMPLVGQTPRLEISISPPSLFVQLNSAVYVVDSEGRIVGRTADFESIKQLVHVNDESGFNAEIGNQILTGRAVTFINLINQQLKQAKVGIESITLPAQPNEVHLRPIGSSFYVKFNLLGDPAQQIGQFLAAKAYFSSSGQAPTEYIDSRIAGKVFYK